MHAHIRPDTPRTHMFTLMLTLILTHMLTCMQRAHTHIHTWPDTRARTTLMFTLILTHMLTCMQCAHRHREKWPRAQGKIGNVFADLPNKILEPTLWLIYNIRILYCKNNDIQYLQFPQNLRDAELLPKKSILYNSTVMCHNQKLINALIINLWFNPLAAVGR